MSEFKQDDFEEALRHAGVKKGDTLFSHSNIGFFGYADGPRTVENTCQTILAAIRNVLGENGTYVVPTFTYSFATPHGVFDRERSPSTCGTFTEYVRKQENAIRSRDPSVSVAALGAQAHALCEKVSENSYDPENSFFARFYKLGGKICNFNFDAGSTFVHFVERELRVPYRFDKRFEGEIVDQGQRHLAASVLWVRYITEGTAAKFESFDALARGKGLYRSAVLKRGFIGCISAEDTFSLIEKTLVTRPWFLTEAEEKKIEPDLKNAKK